MTRIVFSLWLALAGAVVWAQTPEPPAPPARVAGSLIELKQEAATGARKAQKLYADALKANQLFAAAEHWYRLSANQGDASALYALGDLYQRDQGYGTNAVRHNLTNSVVMYKLAALQGYGPAHFKLCFIYWDATSAQRDLTQAYKHLLLSDGNREEFARKLVLEMRQEQIVESERLAKAFQPAPFVKAFEEMVFESIKVTGIMASGAERAALANGAIILPGSTFRVNVAGLRGTVKCDSVDKDSVTVTFNGVQRTVGVQRVKSMLGKSSLSGVIR